MRKIVDTLSWSCLFILFIPCMLIVASWNSLPGEILYPTKLALERTLLLLARPSYAVEGKLNVKYTERRFAESQRLLADQHSVKGLPYLTAQVAATKAVIYRAPNREIKAQLAKEYITTLETVSTQLETEKQIILQGQITATQAQVVPEPTPAVADTSVPTVGLVEMTATAAAGASSPAPTPSPTTVVSPTPPAPTPQVPAVVTSDEVPEQITQTQQILQRTITELKKVVVGILGGSGKSPGPARPRDWREETQNFPESTEAATY